MAARSTAKRLPPGVPALVEDVRVFKAGNSLAVRIPSVVARRLRLADGSPVEMGVEADSLWIRPRRRRAPSLRTLIAGITPDNLHGEIGTGRARGRERLED